MSAAAPIRVVLVDDSPTVRAVLRRVLRRAEDLEVIGEAADGEMGVHLAERLRPDVILMDIAMPKLDGFEATRRIMSRAPTSILILSSEARAGGHGMIFDACGSEGAKSVLAKPESPRAWSELAESLPELVRTLGEESRSRSSLGSSIRDPSAPSVARSTKATTALRYVVVGASTGGPEALHDLLAGLGPRPPWPVLVVQHIAREFELGLADWLSGDLDLDVALAQEGEIPPPGSVRLAPQGFHMRLTLDGRLSLDGVTPPVRGHRPAADLLFCSCAEICGRETAGVLLSGMGRDGVVGMRALRETGGLTLVQDRATSVVFGMPQAALEDGAAELALPPHRLAAHLLESCGAITT